MARVSRVGTAVLHWYSIIKTGKTPENVLYQEHFMLMELVFFVRVGDINGRITHVFSKCQ
jgi:hypothetical protein